LVRHVTALGRKPSTTIQYASILRCHLDPFFDRRPLDRISRADVEAYVAAKIEDCVSPKSVRNHLSLLHSIFEHAEKRGWVRGNPVKLADGPRSSEPDPDIRFLTLSEVEATVRAVEDDVLGHVIKRMILFAAMTGARQGECLAVRWQDIDWTAGRVRIRQNFVRGEFGEPKSKRSSRSVPLADRLASELDRLYRDSALPGGLGPCVRTP
jgi:integrase